METLITFLFGVVVGIFTAYCIVAYIGNRSLKKRKEAVASLENRMKRIKEITAEQVDIASRVTGPQKNSLDGKYKNRLYDQIKQLDEECNEIMQSILDDGYDPEITTMDVYGNVSKMKLSEYMGSKSDESKSSQSKSQRSAQQIGKFTVIRGGKDDDDGGTVH